MESSTQDPIIREIPAQIVLGAVAFGKPKPTTRDHPLASDEACHDLIEHFYTRGGRELDTARVYQNGNCEAMLGRLGASKKIKIATKYNPQLGKPRTTTGTVSHCPSNKLSSSFLPTHALHENQFGGHTRICSSCL